MNWSVEPGATAPAAAWLTVIDTRVAAETVRVAVPEMPPLVAVIVVVPALMAVARPVAAPIDAVAGVLDAHVDVVVMSLFEPSV